VVEGEIVINNENIANEYDVLKLKSSPVVCMNSHLSNNLEVNQTEKVHVNDETETKLQNCACNEKKVDNANIIIGLFIVSDRLYNREAGYIDKTGPVISTFIKERGYQLGGLTIVPDVPAEILRSFNQLREYCDILIYCGGSSLTVRDVTPETLLPMVKKRLTGLEWKCYNENSHKSPGAVLSRLVFGSYAKGRDYILERQGLLLIMPGSPRGALETLEVVDPYISSIISQFKRGHESS